MQNAECKAKRQKPFYRKECKEDKEPEARGTLIHADKTLITDTANIETAVCSCELAGYVVVMRIALAKDVEEFLKEQVRAGLAADPGELANHILRCFCDQQRKPFRAAPQLQTWLTAQLVKMEQKDGNKKRRCSES